MNLINRKIKGRYHEPRREVNVSDPFENLLPGSYVHPPKKGALTVGHRRRKNRGEFFDTVRVALEEHYAILHDALLACGYDLERSALLSLEAYGAARLYWEMNHEPMPKQMATHLRELSLAAMRREESDLFQQLQS